MLSNPLDATGACAAEDMSDPAFVGDLLERGLESGEFPVPQLPEAAMRVVRAWESSNAAQLSEIIKADPALARYVLRIAASAPHRPATPIVSLPHAVAWLGFDEVANMAFTLSLQPTMLDVPGHHVKARRLWRHSLASALWSRQLALALERDRGVCYLCGLLHAIGKGVTLSVSHALARQFGKTLGARDLDLLIERFHREVTARVVTAWGLPRTVHAVATRWEAPESRLLECRLVDAAHRLADCTVEGLDRRDRLRIDSALRQLGLPSRQCAQLFESTPAIDAELDRYLGR